MQLKLSRGILVGNTWREPGQTVEANGRYAEQLLKSGAAHPVAGPIEATTSPPKNAERATAPRQR